MTITIDVPAALLAQKAELESALAGIASEEEKLSVQRKDLQAALNTIASGITVLSGKPLPTKSATSTTRKPMTAEARENIRQGLLRSKAAKATAAQVLVPAPPATVEATERTSKPDTPTKQRASRKAAKK